MGGEHDRPPVPSLVTLSPSQGPGTPPAHGESMSFTAVFLGSLGSYKVMVTDTGPGLIPALPPSSHVTLGKGLLGLSLCICEMEINQRTSKGTDGRS